MSLYWRERRVLVAGGLAMGLAFLDETAVVTALPTIQREFDGTNTETQWIMGAYLLALAALMAAAGRLADLYGRRRLLVFGAVLFAAGSVVAAAAPDEQVLIVARILQGVGGAFLIPLGIACATASLPEERRGWTIGVITTTGMVMLALGPLVGGALVEGPGWRWIFLLNLPALLVIVWFAIQDMVESRGAEGATLDVPGLLFMVAGLSALVLALMEVPHWGATAPSSVAMFAAASVLLAAFVWWERRVADPLVDVRLLRIPIVAGSLIALFAMQFAIVGLTVYVTLDLQHVLDYSPVVAGLVTLPMVILAPFISGYVGARTDRQGPHLFVTGALLLAAAAVLALAVFAGRAGLLFLLPALLAFGIARPVAIVAGQAGAIGEISLELRGLAAALAVQARQLGAVMSVAVLGLVLTAVETAKRAEEFAGIPTKVDEEEREIVDGVLAGSAGAEEALRQLPETTRAAAKAAVATAYTAGFQAAMFVTAGLVLTAALAAGLLLRRRSPAPAAVAS